MVLLINMSDRILENVNIQLQIHACALVYGESGILIRGNSGSGKSQLMLGLIQRGEQQGIFTRMVGDDRIGLQVIDRKLIAHRIPSIEGLIEVRGLGLETMKFIKSCVVSHVIDLGDAHPPRLPDHNDLQTVIEGVTLKRLQVMHSTHVYFNAYGAIDLFLRKL